MKKTRRLLRHSSNKVRSIRIILVTLRALTRSTLSLLPEQQAALTDIKQLLKQFEKAQQLYPSFKKMTNDFSICQTVQFKRRQSALVIWSKVTENLAYHLSRLSQWFGVKIYSIYTRPSSLGILLHPSATRGRYLFALSHGYTKKLAITNQCFILRNWF